MSGEDVSPRPVHLFPRKTARIDRVALRRNVRKAAKTIAEADFLAREIDQRMQERLDYVRLAPERVLDLGCGTGISLAGLAARYPRAECLGIDQESLLLEGISTAGHFLAARAEALPLPAACAGLVWANLLLPWLDDPQDFFREAWRVLSPGGLLMFSSLGPDTLREIGEGLADYDANAHTQHFFDLHDLGDMLLAARFDDPVMDMERLIVTYANLDAFLADLRAAGAACVMTGRRKSLAGRGFRRALERYCARQMQAREDGRLPMTFEILYGHAW
ncbi:MAG: methyltransferase domain-containing protein [Zoogloeaceae bacterium]|jgi:malonyl-CoA O-methyltransferase|nr:methyltransferase domain-containing protein [Zoogloeaceae bacterium]